MSADCGCEFDFAEPDGESSWHYKRTCGLCGFEWGALHCPHDRAQNPCPECGWIDPGKRTPGRISGLSVHAPVDAEESDDA